MMKSVIVNAFDIPDAWFKCIEKCITDPNIYDYVIDKGSFVGKHRKEFDHIVITISNPSNRPLVPNVPDGIPAPCSMAEVEMYALRYLFLSNKAEGEQYTYGERINKNEQIYKVIERLRETPGTNQTCIEIAQPSDIDLDDPPCLRLIDVRLRYSQLHFYVYFRSWDLMAGLPMNLAGLQLLKEWMAKRIGVNDGMIFAMSKGLHLYEYQFEIAKKLVEGNKSDRPSIKAKGVT